MPKRHRPEEIVTKLRRVNVMVSQGSSATEAVSGADVVEATAARAG